MAISITGNEKDALTVMATVSLTGQKLPLYILVKGETVRVEVMQLGELGDNAIDHSPTDDSADDDSVPELLEFLDDRDGGKRIYHILVDIHPVTLLNLSGSRHGSRGLMSISFILE
jgi:hypothetical protein